MANLTRAIQIATEAHDGQVDKDRKRTDKYLRYLAVLKGL